MPQTKSILIIEDDQDLTELIALHLKDLNYIVEKAADGESGMDMALEGNYDLIILDLMLPEMDGLEICKKVRQQNHFTPILILSAKSEELDKILGLELGADDYITKPFSVRELLARIKAIFRRMQADHESIRDDRPKVLEFDHLCIYLDKRKVVLGDKPVDLTAKEFDLLTLFCSHPGRAFSRQELLDLVWGYQFEGYDHTVNSHINRLRNKIENNPADPFYIRTVWGVGYSFVELEPA
ncbi:response regulator [candidate division KSB1 bacterium]|nr:response regulator [candidate division KSB1 bacterium]